MSAPRLTESQKMEIVAMYRRGVLVDRIAETFGVHRSYPCLLAKRRGADLRRPHKARRRMRQAAKVRHSEAAQ